MAATSPFDGAPSDHDELACSRSIPAAPETEARRTHRKLHSFKTAAIFTLGNFVAVVIYIILAPQSAEYFDMPLPWQIEAPLITFLSAGSGMIFIFVHRRTVSR